MSKAKRGKNIVREYSVERYVGRLKRKEKKEEIGREEQTIKKRKWEWKRVCKVKGNKTKS